MERVKYSGSFIESYTVLFGENVIPYHSVGCLVYSFKYLKFSTIGFNNYILINASGVCKN